MTDLRKTLRELPWKAKLVLVIVYDLYGSITRICKGIDEKNMVLLVVGILQLVTCNIFGIMWIVDLVTVITKKEVTVLA